MQIDDADEKVVLTKFLFSLSKSPLSNMAKLMLHTQKYLNVEDAKVARRDQGNELYELSKRKIDELPKAIEGEARPKDSVDRVARPREPRAATQRAQVYTPLNSTVKQVFMYVRDDPSLKWPNKLKTP